VDPLKYQQQPVVKSESKELMTIKLRYKEPKGSTSELISKTVPESDLKQPYAYSRTSAESENFRFASAVAEFGLLLRNSQYKGSASYDQVLEQANQARGNDPWGYRGEFVGLVEKAKSLNSGE
jgi:Ca-activated chloride channel family protein